MRTFIRTKIDINEDPDLSQLGPITSVIVSIQYSLSRSKIARNRERKRKNLELEERMRRIETLKKIALFKIGKKLNNENSSIYDSVTFYVNRSEEDIMDETFNSSDFIAYTVIRVKENKDFLLSFPNLPIKLEIRRKRNEE